MKKEILFQLDIAWQLFEYHCHNLGEEDAMWCKMRMAYKSEEEMKNGLWIGLIQKRTQ